MKNDWLVRGKAPIEWGQEACETLMTQYEPSKLPPENRWHYHQGVFLCGVEDVWKVTGADKYYHYFKEYVDKLIDEKGNFYFARDELDAIQAGLLLFPIYEKTKEEKYKVAAAKLRNILNTINKTSEQGFWHKDKYPDQMWLDGLYMAGPFTMKYGWTFDEPELIDTVLHQEALMRKHTKDERTGLYFHGWDERGETPWSVPQGYHAPEIWGRALGWYGMALTMIIELLPEKHPKRQELMGVVKELVENLVKYQDEETGLWYQIVDKGDKEDNWLETSCTSLFVLTIIRGINQGYIDEAYVSYAKKGYEGIVRHQVKRDDQGKLTLTGICIGTSIGVYEYYVDRETSENDLHGVGAFVLASVQLQEYMSKVTT